MKTSVKPFALGLALPVLLLADVAPDSPLGLALVRESAAVVGAPLTPVSGAGVARRTTRRVVAVEATTASSASAQQQQATAQQQAATAQQQQAVAQQQAATAQQQQAIAQQQAQAAPPAVGTVTASLPAGCTAAPKGGVEYYKCGNVYYRTAFQGNNLVYVVVQQP